MRQVLPARPVDATPSAINYFSKGGVYDALETGTVCRDAEDRYIAPLERDGRGFGAAAVSGPPFLINYLSAVYTYVAGFRGAVHWKPRAGSELVSQGWEECMIFRGLNGGNSPMRVSLALALFFAHTAAALAQQNSNEANTTIRSDDAADAAIKQVLDTYTEAWNRYDSHALAMLFTEDCDYVIVNGGNTHGREALETMLARNFNSNLRNSTRTDSIRRMRFLAPDIASLDDYWALNVPGADQPRREGYYTWILVRQGGRWLIALHHAAQFIMPQPASGK